MGKQKTIAQMTNRQIQVLSKAAVGKSNKEIAQELSISIHTVRNYLRQVEDMLRDLLNNEQFHTRTEVALYAIFGFLPTENDISRIIRLRLITELVRVTD
jgi:DNA-binding CsgD family transcriptional regulator